MALAIAFNPCMICDKKEMCSMCELDMRRKGKVETVQGDKDNNVPSKWISVNDRLPELAGDYLGVKNYGGEDVLVDIVFYDLGWIDHNGEPETEPITHWMPLPKPPKGE